MRLVEPSPAWREAFLDMARDWRDHGVDRYALALRDFDAHLARTDRYRSGVGLPEGHVPGTELCLVDDEARVAPSSSPGRRIVACVRLRLRLTPALEKEGGNVGYDVRPSFRRRGYGTAALRLALPEARARGLGRVRLTVDADNAASVRIIEKNGGVLAGESLSEESGKPILQYWASTSG